MEYRQQNGINLYNYMTRSKARHSGVPRMLRKMDKLVVKSNDVQWLKNKHTAMIAACRSGVLETPHLTN